MLKNCRIFLEFGILLVNVPQHVTVVIGSFKLPVEDHVLFRRQTSDEHVVLRTHSYVGVAALLAV